MNEPPLAPVIAGAAGPELGNRPHVRVRRPPRAPARVAGHGSRVGVPRRRAARPLPGSSTCTAIRRTSCRSPRGWSGATRSIPPPSTASASCASRGTPASGCRPLLYEPATPLGGERSTPAVLDVNGHESRGIAVEHKQARCSNLARRGLPALSLELLGRGEMTNLSPHNHQQLLDVLGQARCRGVLPHHEARPGPPHRTRADRPGAPWP